MDSRSYISARWGIWRTSLCPPIAVLGKGYTLVSQDAELIIVKMRFGDAIFEPVHPGKRALTEKAN